MAQPDDACRCPDIRRVAALQADDPALWFNAQTATEAYLQRALRHLHAVIEGDSTYAALLEELKEGLDEMVWSDRHGLRRTDQR